MAARIAVVASQETPPPEERVCPVLPVRDMVLFPGIIMPLFVGRPRSLRAMESALLQDKKIFVVAQKDNETEDPESDDLYRVGTLCNVLQVVRVPDGTTKVLVEGVSRMRVEEYLLDKEFLTAHVFPMAWDQPDSSSLEPWRRRVLSSFEHYNTLQPRIPGEVMASISELGDLGQLINLVGSHISVKIEERQALLEIQDVESALAFLLRLLTEEIDILELEHDIQNRVRSVVDKHQKEYYLREQLRIIQNELGQGQGEEEEQLRYAERIEASRMSDEARDKAKRELSRLSKMSPISPEAAVIRSYLDWLLDLPWGLRTEENENIARAERRLDRDHYGLHKAKDRILEFLAVRRHAGTNMRGQIICFVGPPGVGKTSLGRSIADSLNRRFVNVSLGGVRDEAEIRGHRRTYIGSLPGRIVQKLARAGSCNPVVLLDEIDKLGNDFRGDPASALLEVLDPQQNATFTDHYLEVPFDLSEVLFITTANVTHTIPKPLLDRMELIPLPGYLAEEKVQIALRYLLPRILKEHGLKRSDIKISASVIKKVIASYTREAGVRGLDRALSTIVRKITRRLVEAADKSEAPILPVAVKVNDLKEYLGPKKLYDLSVPKDFETGNVVGLAWTEAGGDVLLIEVVTMKGKGELVLTGHLGEVMQESARAAVSYLRSESDALGIGAFDWKSVDIHIHVPEGAVPKDGPSAGITMATAILSAVSGRRVRPGIAMTGEISLRGKVLPVGGIREKILAARRHGIHHIVLPSANRVDVEEISRDYTEGMRFDYAEDVMTVFGKGLED
ncbi:endopeptidase La [Fretibacterium sp. OH1220_COT-178]|uniref:endopeptidase La n=1 Tax=Fretibacterium sp. OH1220_COT-178 TaxID=2491047 RepID=UPI0018F5AE42|nr:endopeptidase La [Fretibacterium sp. OH1220_COT-178]